MKCIKCGIETTTHCRDGAICEGCWEKWVKKGKRYNLIFSNLLKKDAIDLNDRIIKKFDVRIGVVVESKET